LEVTVPFFTVEANYNVPHYRHRTYQADTVEQALKLAIEDDEWAEQKEDFECSGETYITGAWLGEADAYGDTEYPVPSKFKEAVQRKADHFDVLLDLLQIVARTTDNARSGSPCWRQRADAAIAKAEAILAGPDDPN